jgi:hypothetical protein
VQNPLREERLYSWRYLVLSAVFCFGLFLLFLLNQLFLGSLFAGLGSLFFLVGLYKSRLVLAQEKIM